MIKECFKEILNPKYKEVSTNVEHILENFDEYQIEYALVNGISISENIIVKKHPRSGFTCFNKDYLQVGLIPMCKLLETKMNRKLKQQLFS
jgi:hypothetical protein